MSTAVQTQPNLPEKTSVNVSPPATPATESPAASPGSANSDKTQILSHPVSSAKESPTNRSPNKPIKIIVVSDMVCPWCYVAFASINRAISDLTMSLLPKPAPKFEIEFRPFPVITNFGSDDVAIDKTAHFERRFGKERMKEMQGIVAKRGRELGIEFKFGGMVRQTTRSHRLLGLAYQRGGMALQQSLLAHLFKAYFEEEKDIGSPALLAYYADLVGLMEKDAAEKWIKSNAGEEEMKKLVAISQGCNISGVPFVVVEGKWAISGGQPEGEYYKVFEKLARGEMS